MPSVPHCTFSISAPLRTSYVLNTLAASLDSNITLVLISKAGINAGDGASSLTIRGKSGMEEGGYQVWTLERPKDGPERSLTIDGVTRTCRLQDEGFYES